MERDKTSTHLGKCVWCSASPPGYLSWGPVYLSADGHLYRADGHLYRADGLLYRADGHLCQSDLFLFCHRVLL